MVRKLTPEEKEEIDRANQAREAALTTEQRAERAVEREALGGKRRREKEKIKAGQGLAEKQAGQVQAGQLGMETELATERGESKEFLEEREFFEKEKPERVELDIEREGIERAPVIGAGIKAFKGGQLGEQIGLGGFTEEDFERRFAEVNGVNITADMLGVKDEQFRTLIQNPQTARELALQEIQKDVLKKGTSISENFGALIEGIGLGKVDKWVGGSMETPRENVATLVSEIKTIGSSITNIREKFSRGTLGDPMASFDLLLEYEKDIARAEQRIKLLSLGSKILIADADALNLIESVILDVKLRLFAAEQELGKSLPGIATNEQVFTELQRVKRGE